MTRIQIIRIVALLAVIFAAGVLTGRLTAPREPIPTLSLGAQVMGVDEMLDRLVGELDLDADQRKAFRPILETWVKEMAELRPGSPERFNVLLNKLAQLRKLIRPEQADAFEAMVHRAERRYERVTRRRGY